MESKAAASDRTSGRKHSSRGELPHGLPATLPNRPAGSRAPTMPPNPTPEVPKQGNKRPHDDEITALPNEDEPSEPPWKKKKKKKSKDKPQDKPSAPEVPDDRAHPGTSAAEPEVTAEKSVPAPAPPKIPEKETEVPKKKKKKKKQKEAGLEKFQALEREAKAKAMAKIRHRKLQRGARLSGYQRLPESPS